MLRQGAGWVYSFYLPGTSHAWGGGAQGEPALPDGGHEGGAGHPQQGPGEAQLNTTSSVLGIAVWV